jgi:hypothetical protein
LSSKLLSSIMPKTPGLLFTGLNTNCRESQAQTRRRWIVTQCLVLKFSPLCTQNQQCQSSWKLCALQNCTFFLLDDFEVFRGIVENVPKF